MIGLRYIKIRIVEMAGEIGMAKSGEVWGTDSKGQDYRGGQGHTFFGVVTAVGQEQLIRGETRWSYLR